MRTLNTGLETYKIDNNLYPAHGIYVNGRLPNGQISAGPTYNRNVLDPVVVTTPISYINSETVTHDVFQQKLFNGSATKAQYDQWVLGRLVYVCYDSASNPALRSGLGAQRYGLWRFSSAGPDQAIYNVSMPPEGTVATRTGAGKVVPYDATNGTVSAGDIFRTQKGELQKQYI